MRAVDKSNYLWGCLALLGSLGACGDTGEAKAEPGAQAMDVASKPSLAGVIHFVSERDGNLEIYRWTQADGATRVTNDDRDNFVAEVEPHGGGYTQVSTQEGATAEAHNERLMWVPQGGAPIQIGEAGRRARSPSWAPDRSFVVFESSAEGSFSDVWRFEPGRGSTRLTTTEHGAFEPAVSPDGQSIAFVSTRDGNPEIYRMAADGTAPQRLTTWRRDDMAPRWSPDGRSLAIVRREQGTQLLFVLRLGEGEVEEQRLVPRVEGEQVRHLDHGWSPDGRSLAYVVDRPTQPPRLTITEVASGETRAVTQPSLRASMPQWSPDGQQLVFAAAVEGGDPNALDLYVVPREGGEAQKVTDHPAPDWLPRWTAQ